jgi:general nucleoside transport system permease protein
MMALSLALQVLRIATPYLLAAAGGVVAERAGIISLSLEGYMLSGACAAAFGAYFGGNPWIGMVAGLSGGMAAAALHALATVRYRADQVVAGIAINLLAIGATRFALRVVFGSSSNSPRVPGFAFGNPLVLMGLLAIPAVALLIDRTRFGLRVRAAGAHPAAATSVGIDVDRIRVAAVLLSGALAGLGGAYLALDQHQFTDEMTAGRGFIAVAAVIFGRWEPARVGVACLLFAVAETVEIHLQGTSSIPSQFVQMIPYVLTIVALAGVVGRSVPPEALGSDVGT